LFGVAGAHTHLLIILPPSEAKRPPVATGRAVELERLSFPRLLPTRRRIAAALIRTSSDLDAFERLGVRHGRAPEVVANTRLFELPAIPVLELYTGPLHQGLDAEGLSEAAAARAEGSLVVASALWGALRPTDRLHLFARLLGIDRLDHTWRAVLPDALADAAGADGVVVDLRSPGYQQAGSPAALSHRTVNLRVDLGTAGDRIGDVVAKRVRGEAAHHLLESGADPADPHALADVLADRWPVRLDAPERPGKPWWMTLSVD
jgi:cytoplasmic iron level regulating protein YaaA (DUF328/UPF0246 family)